jgi:hypothetical protein
MRLIGVVGVLVLMVGCGRSGPCKERSGTYSVKHEQRSGNCGAISEYIVNVDQPAPSSQCVFGGGYSADQCDGDMTSTCPNDNPATGSNKWVTSLTWNEDASHATGVVDLVITGTNGHGSCHSTYDLTYSRI